MILLLASIIFLGFILLQKQINSPLTFKEIVETSQVSYLRTIYHKIIIGIENQKTSLISESLSLPNVSITSHAVVGNIFPPDIHHELKTEIKGRSVLILIELAFQSSSNSYSGFIAKELQIPQQTVSDEIKKLIKLDYIQNFISKDTLLDTRFKYFTLTSKGIIFLHLLKETLSIAIMKMNKDTET